MVRAELLCRAGLSLSCAVLEVGWMSVTDGMHAWGFEWMA